MTTRFTISGPTRAAEYHFIQSTEIDGASSKTATGEPIYAIPGGGKATQAAILDHLHAQRGHRMRARRKE